MTCKSLINLGGRDIHGDSIDGQILHLVNSTVWYDTHLSILSARVASSSIVGL